MAGWIVVLAAVLIVGSMMWVLPSPVQRQQMKMRRDAMLKGLQVQLLKIKDIQNSGQEIPCIAYRLPNKREHRLQGSSWALYRQPEGQQGAAREGSVPGWIVDISAGRHSFADVETVSKLLTQLPEDVLAVQAAKGTMSVYWREKGEAQDVDVILSVLSKLQGA